MPKEQYIDESRGIFDQRACVKASGADMPEVYAEFAKSRKPDATFARLERVARGVLADHGFTQWPTAVPKHADPAARDAGDLLNSLATLRGLIAEGDIEWVAAEAFTLGRIVERLRLRLEGFESPAEAGLKSAEGGKKRLQWYKDQAPRWQRLVDAMMSKGKKYTAACDQVAYDERDGPKGGVDRKTIIVHTEDRQKKQLHTK